MLTDIQAHAGPHRTLTPSRIPQQREIRPHTARHEHTVNTGRDAAGRHRHKHISLEGPTCPTRGWHQGSPDGAFSSTVPGVMAKERRAAGCWAGPGLPTEGGRESPSWPRAKSKVHEGRSRPVRHGAGQASPPTCLRGERRPRMRLGVTGGSHRPGVQEEGRAYTCCGWDSHARHPTRDHH